MYTLQSRRNYSMIAGLLFAVVALIHVWRLAVGADITIDGEVIPMWVSWIGLIATAILAYFGFRFGTRG